MKSILCAVFSVDKRIGTRTEVVTNSAGMKAGCKTSQTVRASPVREAMSK